MTLRYYTLPKKRTEKELSERIFENMIVSTITLVIGGIAILFSDLSNWIGFMGLALMILAVMIMLTVYMDKKEAASKGWYRE